MNVSDALVSFLSHKRQDFAAKPGELMLDFWLHQQHRTALETQVNVAAGDGQRVPGRGHVYSDGFNEWWPIRIPKFADTEAPKFDEYNLKWPLELHAEAIGSTGWHWQTKRSLYVGFDFDRITDHASGRGVTDVQLEEIKRVAQTIPYVQVRRSTSGKGLHFYVFFEPPGVETKTHDEHAALARQILVLMSRDAGFNFASQLDVCGGNMWFWSRKANNENQGLTLIKSSSYFPLADIPANWRDHIEVIARKRAKVVVREVGDEELELFDSLTNAHRIVPLDDKHKAHMDEIVAAGFAYAWDADRNMLTTHTCAFKHLKSKCEDTVGSYETISAGKDPQTPNCFAFPADGGAWKVYRFGPGVAEAPTWEQDGQGYTTCWFNRRDNLKTAARAKGGRDLAKGGYEFDTAEKAAEVAASLGAKVELDDILKKRKGILNRAKDGRLVLEVPKESGDVGQVNDKWNNTDKKGSWTCVFDVPTEPLKDESVNYDDKVRCLKTPEGKDAGWRIKDKQLHWIEKKADGVKRILQSYGNSKPDAEAIMGTCDDSPWQLVALPFKPEYPGGREWNLSAPQLRYAPAPHGGDNFHPTWDLMLTHLGKELDADLANLEWARQCNIRTGADYLTAWYAAIFRDPRCRLPYLFFFGPENTGKSSFWEAFELLVTGGVVKADRSLTSRSDFNGELAGAILCVVEERDISRTEGAIEKIKDAVTGLHLSIRALYKSPYSIPNTTHWCQTANTLKALMVPPGSTRITVVYVNPFEPGEEIAKDELHARLKAEAPAFMRTLIDFQLPPVVGRLALPIVENRFKAQSEEYSTSMLDQFLKENTFYVPGERVAFSDFYNIFIDWLPADERHSWSQIKVTRGLPVKQPCGGCENNKRYIGNLSFENIQVPPDTKAWTERNKRLVRE